MFSMAANGDMPQQLAHVHPAHQVPDRAELAVAAVVIAVILVADVRGAIGFSSFAVLLYYAIANGSAFTLPRDALRWPRVLTVLGLAGCLVLAFTLPLESVAIGGAVVAAGAMIYGLRALVARPEAR
jgi:APA family basic amino acid/polyamine antiporter